MIKVSCRFAHSFKIRRVPQPIIPFCVPPQPIQGLRSGRGGKIDIPYIRFLDGRVPEPYELWDLAEDGVREVHPYARFELLYDFIGYTFHTHFFNVRRFQIPFLGCRSVNMSVEFLDVVRTTQQVRSRVASWTKNIFVHSWGPYPTMIPRTISTITRHAYNVPVTFHGPVMRANHKCLRLKRVDWRRTCNEELLSRILQDIRDEVCAEWGAALSDISNDGWLEGSNSD